MNNRPVQMLPVEIHKNGECVLRAPFAACARLSQALELIGCGDWQAVVDGRGVEPSNTFGEILTLHRHCVITVFSPCLSAPAHPEPPKDDVCDINDLMGARQRADRVEGKSLDELKEVAGLQPLIDQYTNYSVRDKRTMMTQKSAVDYRKHTNLIVIGQFLTLVCGADAEDDLAAETLVMPEKVQIFCDKVRALPHKSNTKKKKCDAMCSVYSDMDELVEASPGCLGPQVTRDAISRARRMVSRVRTVFQREYVAEGNGGHFQSEWVRRGKWVSRDEWHCLRTRVADELEVQRPYTKREAYWYQSILIVSLSMNGGGLRPEVLNNMFLEDVVTTERGLVLRIVSEKTTTKDLNMERQGKHGKERVEIRPSQVSRTVPVPLDSEIALRNWIRTYRRILSCQVSSDSVHQKFLFLNTQGRCLRHHGGLAQMTRSVTDKFIGKALTVMDLRHLRTTWLVRSVMENDKIPTADKKRIIERQAQLAGHSVEVMMANYYIRGDHEEALTMFDSLKEMNDLI